MESAFKFSGQLTPGEAVAWICVASPDSRRHVQPVPAGDFIIGSGSACHLRLGDESIPELLAGITAEEGCAQLRCLSSIPVVCLNGEPVEQSFLRDGDLLEAGPYRLVFCFSHAESEMAVPLPVQAQSSGAPEFQHVTPPAEQLVDWLGEQIRIIEESERTPETGLREMLEASRSTAEDTGDPASGDLTSGDLGRVLRQVERNQHALRLQNEAILEQLARLTRHYAALVNSPAVPNDGVVPLRTTGSLPPRRASA